MKVYRKCTYDQYQRYFIYRKPNEYEGGKLYTINWYYSLCDWAGNELDGFYRVLDDYEQRALRRSYWRFVLCCNLTPSMNCRTAAKIYARFVGGYCEGLRTTTAGTLAVLVDELARSIAHGESKEEQLEIVSGAVAYMYKE